MEKSKGHLGFIGGGAWGFELIEHNGNIYKAPVNAPMVADHCEDGGTRNGKRWQCKASNKSYIKRMLENG